MRVDYAARARALVGAPFRAQGRGPGGFDCVGVVLEAFCIPHEDVASNYRMRGDHREPLKKALAVFFRAVPTNQLRPGDLMLFEPFPRQLHLAVATKGGFVHAHAGIRKVVETPGSPEWPLLRVYRKRSR